MGERVDLNGISTFYEVHGDGDPLVLLHGGFGGADLWGAQIADLEGQYRVLVPEQRGRGRTADGEGPITYQLLADDLVAFLERVVGTPAFLVGASDGGNVGLIVAMQRPDLLRKLVTIGANFDRDGLLPAASMWTDLAPDHEAWAGRRAVYEEVSPDGPDHFPVVFDKLQAMWRQGPMLTVGDLATIPIPVLVIAGDDDVIRHEHTITLYESLRQGQLAIVPGTSHGVFAEKPELLDRLIVDFLNEEGSPDTMFPIRRSASSK